MKLALRNSNNLYSLEERMDRLFNEFFEPLAITERELTLKPAIELSEDEKNYYIKAEIPGIKKEDLDIQVQEDSVLISGETKSQMEEKNENICRSEFRYGKFSRTVPLPEKIDNQKASAEYKDGILPPSSLSWKMATKRS
ncbi:MAG TPA: molecular chaperone [Cyanobacteria bacterium UBA9579]|nr:molecular chaperone [Cyanobacteria bacterium UBA9579]